MHVLVVEDEEPIRQVILRNLERRGYRVSEARTVAWAVESCGRDGPDVLVLDINLPDGSGWDVLRELGARGLPRPAVVVISAAPPPRRRLAEFGPVSFLPKPFLIDALLRAVHRAMPGGRPHAALDHPAV
jgi:DNA-binding response OmpR family regulator